MNAINGIIVALDDEICDLCQAEVLAGEAMYRIKSRLGHHLVCELCIAVQPGQARS